MSSELRVDKIVPVDGVPSGGGGGIVQVLHTNKKTLQNFNSTVPSFTDISNLSLSITPKFNTSKILLSYNIYVSADNSVAFFRILRGSTFIEGPSGTPAPRLRSPCRHCSATCGRHALNTLCGPLIHCSMRTGEGTTPRPYW